MTLLRSQLRGAVVPAVPVPFTADREIDQHTQQSYAEWMTTQAVGGVAVWAHTGRGLCLDASQRAVVLDCWTRTLGSTPVICGVGVPHDSALPGGPARTDRVIDLAVAMTEEARVGGAAGVLVHPPTALREAPDLEQRVSEYHAAIAGVGLPVLAFYLYEAAGGISYSPDLTEALLEIDGVIGIKLATLDSVMTFQDLAEVVRSKENSLLITGEDRFLGYSLMLGADAALVGIAAACTDKVVTLCRTWFDGDFEEFARSLTSVDDFARSTFVSPMEGYVQRMLWALEADGVIAAGTLDPFAPTMRSGERESVRAAVQRLRSS